MVSSYPLQSQCGFALHLLSSAITKEILQSRDHIVRICYFEGVTKSNNLLLTGLAKIKPYDKSIIQIPLELWWAWCCWQVPGETVPSHGCPPSWWRTFSNVQSELSWCNFILFPHVLVLVTREGRSAASPLLPFLRMLWTATRVPSALLVCELYIVSKKKEFWLFFPSQH